MRIQKSDLEKVTAEILLLKQQTAVNIIEIGKRLIQVKEQLPHGEWGKWLAEKVDISYRSAARFIQVAKEFSNLPTLATLQPSKVFALLDVPAEGREDFVNQPHQLPDGQVKTVSEMTTRELQQAIKAQKEAEAKAQKLQKEIDDLEEDKQTLAQELRKAQKKLKEAEDKPPVEIEKTIIPPDYHKVKAQAVEMEARLKNSEQKLKDLEQEKLLLEKKARLNEQEAEQFRNLKKSIDQLKQEKNDIARQIEAATSISKFVVEIENMLQTKLAPIKYSRAIAEQKHDPVVVRNLKDIINRVEDWCGEMRDLISDRNIIDVEVV